MSVSTSTVDESVRIDVGIVVPAPQAPFGIPAEEEPLALRSTPGGVPVVVGPVEILCPEIQDHVSGEVLDIHSPGQLVEIGLVGEISRTDESPQLAPAVPGAADHPVTGLDHVVVARAEVRDKELVIHSLDDVEYALVLQVDQEDVPRAV